MRPLEPAQGPDLDDERGDGARFGILGFEEALDAVAEPPVAGGGAP